MRRQTAAMLYPSLMYSQLAVGGTGFSQRRFMSCQFSSMRYRRMSSLTPLQRMGLSTVPPDGEANTPTADKQGQTKAPGKLPYIKEMETSKDW